MFKKLIGLIVFFLIFLFLNNTLVANEIVAYNISKYLESLSTFKCNFVQANPDGTISEGTMLYSEKKIRINYKKPSKITFIAKSKKAMYYHEDLEEVHYFNPKKTIFVLFNNLLDFSSFPKNNYNISVEDKAIEVQINNTEVEEIQSFILMLQNEPVELKKIKWVGVDNLRYSFSVFNMVSGIIINDKEFNMAHPLLNN